MKAHPFKRVLFMFLVLIVFLSCNKNREDAVTVISNNNPPPLTFPPLSQPAAGVFNFLSQSSYPIQGYTTRSRYVLYDNGTFGLQYADNGGFDYHGWYTKANTVITFKWEGWSTAGPWGATGTLRGDTLTVEYNTVMMLSDFEDAVYLRKP